MDLSGFKLIYMCYAGSYAYGTHTPDSDIDYRGICIPSEAYLIGLKQFEQYEDNLKDKVIYSLEKFVRLALGNNPNILELLFMPDKKITHLTPIAEELLDLRYDFLSLDVYRTFRNYAFNQLRRMTHFNLDKKNNSKRIELIKKLGYDTKHASHCIRLLKMGIEVLYSGEIIVERPDYQELLDIRNGKYTLEEIQDFARSLDAQLERAYRNSRLPENPNYEKIHSWLINAHKRRINNEI